jgi:hypothetical protein
MAGIAEPRSTPSSGPTRLQIPTSTGHRPTESLTRLRFFAGLTRLRFFAGLTRR